jgi:hypothetical protein
MTLYALLLRLLAKIQIAFVAVCALAGAAGGVW